MSTTPFPQFSQVVQDIGKRLLTVKPKEPKMTVGLDVGASAIKVIALGPRKAGGSRPVIGQNLVALQPGQEVDPSELIKTAIIGLRFPVRSVSLGVSGQWVIMRIVEMPTMKPDEIMQALPFEAQRYLPFSIQDVIVSGAVLGAIDAKKLWVLIVACKKELVHRRVDWVRRAGLEVALIDVDALAVANGFLARKNGHHASGTRALINVGAQLTNLLIFQDDVPYLVRDISWGAEKLIRSVAGQAGTTPEAVKADLAKGALSPELQSGMKLAVESLVTELQMSFDYFENRFGQPPEAVFTSGGVGQTAGFLEALKGYLTQTITPWVPLQELSGQFAVAYGLALRSS